MKLSDHYNKASIITTISVLLAGGVIYFFAIIYISRLQLDRDLTEEIDELKEYIGGNNRLPTQVDFDEDVTTFTKTDQTTFKRRYFDTAYINPKEKKNEEGRAVEDLIFFNGQHYKVIISESREGTEYLVQIIALITLALMIGLLVALFLINRYLLRDLWKPFYNILSELKAFNISEPTDFNLQDNKVDEFAELNQAVQIMSERIKDDFLHLKHLTENASHEMMTPLAVITTKLDTLIQDESLNPAHYDLINDIYTASGKLLRLNQTMLLLVKIENNLIEGNEVLRLDNLIREKLVQFQELLNTKHITVTEKLEGKEILASKYLVDILLNNLFSNAIRHNTPNGRQYITLTPGKLIIKNTGSQNALHAETIFDRFQKGSQSDGTGLGLTIVKNICNLYNWKVNYYFDQSLHTFEIVF
ncbi:MAG: HAMP domain-containing histidine kinase [Bacteroidetes bacterium]|jgi:signal transduction histidine kinase|nr:HAMP domain-containing histidine kinase [Bacteroidota bacterium]